MRLYQFLLLFMILVIATACGDSTYNSSAASNGFPSVSVKCGTKACVK